MKRWLRNQSDRLAQWWFDTIPHCHSCDAHVRRRYPCENQHGDKLCDECFTEWDRGV